jgi:hypothetical protein
LKQELKSVEQNRTWELVPLPDGHRPITLKWVFKLKKDELSVVIEHKAWLVARGFVQQEGIDYDEAFTPVARMESVRVLALAAQEGWQVHHMDVKSATGGELIDKPSAKARVSYFSCTFTFLGFQA